MKFLIFSLLFASVSAHAAMPYVCHVSVGDVSKGEQHIETVVVVNDDMTEVPVVGNWVFVNRSQINANPGALEFLVKNKKTGEKVTVYGNEEESITSMKASSMFANNTYVILTCMENHAEPPAQVK